MRIAFIGFGTWGIALARLLHDKGHAITAWDPSPPYLAALDAQRTNPKLPGVVLPRDMHITHEVAQCAGADMYVLALPSRDVGLLAQECFRTHIWATAPYIVSVTKGLVPVEGAPPQRISEYIYELSGLPVVALTGPSHAEEVVQGIPTCVVAAAPQESPAREVQALFTGDFFRVYTTTDLVGAELGGTLKNVIALAAGVSDGLGFGDNTRAALITRGMAEMTRLGVALGAQAHTFAGLSGMGDLIVTCNSRHSRNWQAGHLIAQLPAPIDPTHIQATIGLAEGIQTAATALQLAHTHTINMPIIEEINQVLFHQKPPKQAVTDLLLRQRKGE